MKKNLSILSIVILFSSFSFSQKLKINELFNEGAVLQRNSKVIIWGKSEPLKDVSILIQGKRFKSCSDNDGNWKVSLNALKEGGPYPLTLISEKDTIKLNEIYVGEVWIAGGQSNMAFMLEKSDNGKEEIAGATNKNIRFMLVPYKAYEGDKNRGDMNWRTATTENVAPMSAVAYFFAKDLQARLNVPIGVICCYKGGSGAETWMSRESLLKNPMIAPIVENYESYFAKLGNEKYTELLTNYEKDL